MTGIVEEYKAIRRDYAYNPSVMSEEDARTAALKRIIDRLPLADKTIYLLYVDCQSYRKLGRKLGLSHMTVRKECIRIKKRILEEYGRLH